jgi:hypothetical protein
MKPGLHEITRFLNDWSAGDVTALDRLTPPVYYELHGLAINTCDAGEAGHLLQRQH